MTIPAPMIESPKLSGMYLKYAYDMYCQTINLGKTRIRRCSGIKQMYNAQKQKGACCSNRMRSSTVDRSSLAT